LLFSPRMPYRPGSALTIPDLALPRRLNLNETFPDTPPLLKLSPPNSDFPRDTLAQRQRCPYSSLFHGLLVFYVLYLRTGGRLKPFHKVRCSHLFWNLHTRQLFFFPTDPSPLSFISRHHGCLWVDLRGTDRMDFDNPLSHACPPPNGRWTSVVSSENYRLRPRLSFSRRPRSGFFPSSPRKPRGSHRHVHVSSLSRKIAWKTRPLFPFAGFILGAY